MKAQVSIRLTSSTTGQDWAIPVLHDDDCLLALDKPAGLLVLPARDDPDLPNLMQLLQAGIEEQAPWAVRHRLAFAATANRLDPESSGIVLVARDKRSLARLRDQFGSGKPLSTSIALVHGTPEKDRWEVDVPLGRHPRRPELIRVDRLRGKKSLTRFSVERRFATHALVKCQSLTGRAFQERVHLRCSGLHVVGDPIYGGRPLLLSKLKTGYKFKPDRPERPLMGRVALHTSLLTVNHPVSGDSLSITSPLPKDFTVSLRYLDRYEGSGPAPAPVTA